MKDKFIMMNIDDERSKKIAEVLGNKTCKKIIDHLSETNEASEKDIADALNIPINTAEYSLKKLLGTGLVEKTKNFFWSKKGKKITMYKLAKKHIIISPKYSKPNLTALKTILPILAIIAAMLFVITLFPQDNQPDIHTDELKTFSSQAELENFLENNIQKDSYGMFIGRSEASFDSSVPTAGSASVTKSNQKADDFSTTNIQVQGVDEPDIVKNDDKYIYVVSGTVVSIIDAFPAENMNVLSEINLTEYISNIFINDDRLIVLSNHYKENTIRCITTPCISNAGYMTKISVYDIADRINPELEQEYEVEGNYRDARMIDDYIYTISTKYINVNSPMPPIYIEEGIAYSTSAKEVAYFDSPSTNYVFTSISAVDLEKKEFNNAVYLIGGSHTVYVSQNNIYLTYTKISPYTDVQEGLIKEVFLKIMPQKEKSEIQKIWDSNKEGYKRMNEISEIVQDYSLSLRGNKKENFDKELMEKTQEFLTEFSKKSDKTIIQKIKVDELDIEYEGVGEVSGRVLNQFSMDEYNQNFRIATTTGRGDNSLNHLYVLNEDLEVIGKLEDLAEGEKIYSARFMGERAYMVTFRQVDPLFVIDLSDPENPEALGQLKVTGFSNYLHPYDENHIIGIGKEATEQGRVQGVKIAIFDVTDVNNPIETAKYEVEQKWSDSNALYDHKAFLFDKEKNLLVLPMSYTEEWTSTNKDKKYEYWQGAFVFKIQIDKILLKGKIDHKKDKEEEAYYYSSSAVQRSLFMDDTLYTISRAFVKANDLINWNLNEISKVSLPEQDLIFYGRGMIEEAVSVSVG